MSKSAPHNRQDLHLRSLMLPAAEAIEILGGADTKIPSLTERIRSEQVAMIYGVAPAGIVAALVACVVMTGAVISLHGAPPPLAIAWAVLLSAIGLGHLALCQAFRRASGAARLQQRWDDRFCLFALGEGLSWGVGAWWLLAPEQTFSHALVLPLLAGIGAGSAMAFGCHLPAFHRFFFGALIPAAIRSLHASDASGRIEALYVFVFIGAILALAHVMNRHLATGFRLRFELADLAEDLRAQKSLAEHAMLAKTRFLASASHDLRQPVHALGMFVGALASRAMDQEARRLVARIDESVTALDALFLSLLDISRLDAGIVEVRPRAFPIQPLLERIRRDHAAEAFGKGLRLVLHPSSAIVATDPVLLERILRNIVSNAIRYTDRGRVVIGCRGRRDLRIEVWDTGRGIDAEHLAHVFQEFFQLGNPERDRAKGLGLGLAIVKRLSHLLALDYKLRSRPGKGSVFSITLPRGTAPDPEVLPSLSSPGATLHSGLILVIDDEIAIQDGMISLLSGWGHDVLAAGSLSEMLRRTADLDTCPDLIICDYRLRDSETGIAAIEHLRSEFNVDIPAMLISGDTAPDRLIEAQASGFVLLHKPVAPAELRAAIEAHMRGHAALSQQRACADAAP